MVRYQNITKNHPCGFKRQGSFLNAIGTLKKKLLFLNSIFPILSETFIFDQYQRLKSEGLEFEIISSHKPSDNEVHPHMKAMQNEVSYLCEARWGELLLSHWLFLISSPVVYFKALLRAFLLEEKLKTSIAHLTGALLLKRRYPELTWVHSHFTYGATAIAFWLKYITNTPYSITLHGADLTFDKVPDLALKMQNADKIVSISQFNLDYLNKYFPAVDLNCCQVIPLGVPAKLSVSPQTNQVQQPLEILSVGRLSIHKAQHLLIEACSLLQKNNIKFNCTIIGEGPERQALTQLIEQYSLAEHVQLVGAKFHHEVLASYANADVFVLSSITEGMPLVLMEAMQNGVLVIAPDIAGIPELLDAGKAGILVPVNDVQALSDAIEKAALDPSSTLTMQQHAIFHIQQHFDLDKNTRMFAAIFRSLFS
ncbi:MAG: glycosyltransferase [Pseudoalteromonas tunicata]|nr:glycosyltransferase [Pseudoalteromonas tunicata]MDP4985709.1 glycosyltransferase [Pseudoalteromonas tunicata]